MSIGEANRRARKVWYEKNKQSLIDKQREKRKEIKDWFRKEVLDGTSCIRCGENHPACMDFHHRDPSTKLEEVCEMPHKKYSREKILEEVAKCDVLCANCHRKHHHEERIGGSFNGSGHGATNAKIEVRFLYRRPI